VAEPLLLFGRAEEQRTNDPLQVFNGGQERRYGSIGGIVRSSSSMRSSSGSCQSAIGGSFCGRGDLDDALLELLHDA
jgi:hypothetical protein